MPVVQPPLPRYAIEDLDDWSEISIPSRKHWFSIIYYGAGLIVAVVGIITSGRIAVAAFYKILFGVDAPWLGVDLHGDIYDWIAPIMTTVIVIVFGLYAFLSISALLWQIAGYEIIEIRKQSLTLCRYAFGLGRPKEYLGEHIRNLRIVSVLPTQSWIEWFGFEGVFTSLIGGVLAFDYGARTFRFGASLDEAEARQLIAEILKRFPEYQSTLGQVLTA